MTAALAVGSLVQACSSDFQDCHATRTCEPAGAEAGDGDAGQPGSGADSGGSEQGGAGPAGRSGSEDWSGSDGGSGGVEVGEAGDAGADGEAGAGGAGNEPVVQCADSLVEGCLPSHAGSIFVDAAASAAGDGSAGAPLPTITEALALAVAQGAMRVVICNATYAERVSLTQEHRDLELVGGFDCATWRYDPSDKPTIEPIEVGYALELADADGTRLSDLRFIALPAATAGASSVAGFIADSSGVMLTRVELQAGAGRDGAAGALEPFVAGAAWPSAAQLKGNDGTGMSSATTTLVGGAARQVTCPGGATTAGGRGGSHPISQAGQPGLPASRGGAGGSTAANAVCNGAPFNCICTQQTDIDGKSGSAGSSGSGASDFGAVTATGFAPRAGTDGGIGASGGGGGGGNGTWHEVGKKGFDQAWYGGGGGGAGGCGGNGASGGQGGGASIALLVASSGIIVTDSVFVTDVAGDGGDGLAGQTGQTGGAGGQAVGGDNSQPCDGGKGGSGGPGGASGGGAGGISVGIVWAGTEPFVDAASSFSLASAGAAGAGGTETNGGIAGVARDMLQVNAE